jgi:acyl-CoA reductase-like NAD-dependent aldehyde dehydrogenase
VSGSFFGHASLLFDRENSMTILLSDQANQVVPTLIDKYTHTINGLPESSEVAFDVIDPSRAVAFARCPEATREQLDRAVASARHASTKWEALGWVGRSVYLARFIDALREHADELAPLLTREQGKPLADSKVEIIRAADASMQILKRTIASEVLRDTDQERVDLYYRSLRVTGVISPWNVPVALMMLRVIPSLYTGSAVVAKPSPYTPLTTLKIGDLARGILPPGVFNVIAGGDVLGEWITQHPGIERVSFTGSVPTGKRVMASSVNNLKRVTLELGGNDPAIVLDDIDPTAIAERIFWSAFRNSGQICMAIKRLYVHENIFEPMVDALARLARNVKLGNGLEAGVQMGPLQNEAQFRLVKDILDDTRRQPDVNIVTGGATLDRPGYFIAPTIVTNIKEGTRLVDEEQFGPVLPVLQFSDTDDVIRRANNTRYGLSASVWSGNLNRAAHLAGQIEAGTVWVNNHMFLDVDTPYGGWKDSGVGRGNGDIGLKSCMESHVVRINKVTL